MEIIKPYNTLSFRVTSSYAFYTAHLINGEYAPCTKNNLCPFCRKQDLIFQLGLIGIIEVKTMKEKILQGPAVFIKKIEYGLKSLDDMYNTFYKVLYNDIFIERLSKHSTYNKNFDYENIYKITKPNKRLLDLYEKTLILL